MQGPEDPVSQENPTNDLVYATDQETILATVGLIEREIKETYRSLLGKGRDGSSTNVVPKPITIEDISAGKLPEPHTHEDIKKVGHNYGGAFGVIDRQGIAVVLLIDQLTLANEALEVEILAKSLTIPLLKVPIGGLSTFITGLPPEAIEMAEPFAEKVFQRACKLNPDSIITQMKKKVVELSTVLKAAADIVKDSGGPKPTKEKLNILQNYKQKS